MTPLQQIGLERAGMGLRAWDPDKACPGLTLFTPVDPESRVYLIELDGAIVHTWCMPYPALYGYLTERGTLVYNGRIDSPVDSFLCSSTRKGGVLLEVDWHGEVVWEVRHPHHHHDGIRLANGNALLLCLAELPGAIAQRVAGGRSGSEFEGRMYADYLVEMTTDGRCVWEWRSWDHLVPEEFRIVNPEDARSEWTHANSVVELVNGDLMLSFQRTSTVVSIDRESGTVVRKIRSSLLNNLHAASALPNGNVLVVDSSTPGGPLPFSRVIEIDSTTGDVIWIYQETPPSSFFSPLISNAQRLSNGNTLINEGRTGRLFEVTSEGKVVWDYINPYFSSPAARDQQNAVCRAYRYPLERVAHAIGAG